MIYGTTFSQKYCNELELDWKQVYEKIVSELGLSTIRLCAHWDLIEPEQGKFKLEDMKWQLDMAAEYGIQATVAIGRKTPRWPEFHEPKWALKDKDSNHKAALGYIETIIKKFDHHPALHRWQMENEPFWSFGKPIFQITEAQLLEEIALAKTLTGKPIVLTDTGEWSFWRQAIKIGDQVGINIYPIVYKSGKYSQQLEPIWLYKFKKWLLRKSNKPIIVAELQAEPWGPGAVKDLSKSEWLNSISPEKLEKNIRLAQAAGFQEVWLWGAEWWVFLLDQGDDSMWKKTKELISQGQP